MEQATGLPWWPFRIWGDTNRMRPKRSAEECGVKITNLVLGPYTNDIFLETDKHYITLYVIAKFESGTPELKEPDKWLKWDWFEIDDMPTPLFLPFKNLINSGFKVLNNKEYHNIGLLP